MKYSSDKINNIYIYIYIYFFEGIATLTTEVLVFFIEEAFLILATTTRLFLEEPIGVQVNRVSFCTLLDANIETSSLVVS
jgi:hypothetical protein